MADKSIQERHSDAEFEVFEVGEGPAAAAAKVASFMIGDPPTVRRGETDPDPVELERSVRSKAKPRCRMFHLSDQVEAQAWADLEQQALVEGTVKIQKIKEVTNGVEYSLVVQWLEFERPEPVVRESVEYTLREKRAALLASIEPAAGKAADEKPKPDRCRGITGKGTPCTRKAREDGYCRTHKPKLEPRVAVPMDAPPPTHTPLGTTG